MLAWANWFDVQKNQRYQQKADIKTDQFEEFFAIFD